MTPDSGTGPEEITITTTSGENVVTKVITITQAAGYKLPTLYRNGIYETKLAAKTSVLKEMNVKVYNSGTGKNENVKVVYRAPANKSYTILMAYSGGGDLVNYTSMAHGRMWAKDNEKAFTFGGEKLFFGGRTLEGLPNYIGKNGANIPMEFEFLNAVNPSTPLLSFSGVGTMDLKNGRIASITGVAYSENMTPANMTKHSKAEQGVLDTKRAPGEESDALVLWKPSVGCSTVADVYYPQASLDAAWELTPAHFLGTYTTRFNASLTKKADGHWPSMVEQVESKVPVLKR